MPAHLDHRNRPRVGNMPGSMQATESLCFVALQMLNSVGILLPFIIRARFAEVKQRKSLVAVRWTISGTPRPHGSGASTGCASNRRIFGRPIDSHATARCQSV